MKWAKRSVQKPQSEVNYKSVDEIATVWCEWCEMMLRHEKSAP